MHITLRQLKIFIEIYLQGSTIKASKSLNLSQSAVSTALKELEAQLDTPLFSRFGRRLHKNAAATLLYPQAVAVLAQINDIENVFQKNILKLHIGASTTIATYILPAKIADFKQKHPEIEIFLHVHNSCEVMQKVENFEYDLGFIEGVEPVSHNCLDIKRWLRDELVFFKAKNSRFKISNLADLENIPFVIRESGSGTRAVIEKALFQKIQIKNLIEIGNSEAIKQAVICDLGVGCLSKIILKAQAAKIETLDFNLPLSRTFWSLRNKKHYLSKAAQIWLAEQE